MFDRITQFEIFYTIIKFISVNMVNMLSWPFKWSAKMLFHDIAVFSHYSLSYTDHSIGFAFVRIFSKRSILTHFKILTKTAITTTFRWSRFTSTAWMKSFRVDSHITWNILALC